MPRYYHRQTSMRSLLLFVPVAAVVTGAALFAAREPVPLAVLLAILTFTAIVIGVFSTLIVEVTDTELTVGFSFGALRRRIPLGEIVAARPITLPWWYGTGMKVGRRSVTYLLWPGPAVAVELKNGRTVQIGYEDVDGLMRALARS